MKLEDIFAEWDNDSQIDKTRLDAVSLGIPQLHAKYARYVSHERLVLKKYEAELKELKLEKHTFYVDGPTQEQLALGWQLPPKGRILKSDVAPYMEADKDIIALSLKIGMQHEKIETLKTIMSELSSMRWNVRNAIDWMRFMNGS